jgi:hypothetical protein
MKRRIDKSVIYINYSQVKDLLTLLLLLTFAFDSSSSLANSRLFGLVGALATLYSDVSPYLDVNRSTDSDKTDLIYSFRNIYRDFNSFPVRTKMNCL